MYFDLRDKVEFFEFFKAVSKRKMGVTFPHASRIKDQGSRIKDQGSNGRFENALDFKHQVSFFMKNEQNMTRSDCEREDMFCEHSNVFKFSDSGAVFVYR